MPRRIYVVGSLKEPGVPHVAAALRAEGHYVFDDWHGAGPQADRYWQEYEQRRGRTYIEALHAPAAQHNFQFDKKWLDWADTAVLVMPAGKSGHMEGMEVQKHGEFHVLFPGEEPESWDLMYLLADGVHLGLDTLLPALRLPTAPAFVMRVRP